MVGIEYPFTAAAGTWSVERRAWRPMMQSGPNLSGVGFLSIGNITTNSHQAIGSTGNRRNHRKQSTGV